MGYVRIWKLNYYIFNRNFVMQENFIVLKVADSYFPLSFPKICKVCFILKVSFPCYRKNWSGQSQSQYRNANWAKLSTFMIINQKRMTLSDSSLTSRNILKYQLNWIIWFLNGNLWHSFWKLKHVNLNKLWNKN